MKIIQVIPRLELSGAEVMCGNLSKELNRMGEEVIVVSLYNHESSVTKRLERSGIRIIYLDKTTGLDMSLFSKLRHLFRKERPDAIHTHQDALKYVIPGAVMTRVPKVIHTLHNVASKENTPLGRKLNKIFFKMKRVTPVALSNLVQDTVTEYYKISPLKVPVITNGISLSKCVQKEDYGTGETISILHVGRMTLAKNQLELLEAVRLLKEKGYSIRLTMIGDGELRDRILEGAQQRGLSEEVVWVQETNDVFTYLNKADIFALPSIYEGIPMSLIEAMGTGLPIVASRVGGIPDMLKDGESGLLCEPDANSIAEKLEQFIQDENLRRTCGQNAIEQVQPYTSRHMAEQYRELYM